MKKTNLMLVLVLSITVGIIGATCADIPVNATPEIQGITTATGIDAAGLTSTAASLVLQIGSQLLHDPPLENGGYQWYWWTADDEENPTLGYTLDPFVAEIYGTPAPEGEVQYTAAYNEHTTAVSGSTKYLKSTAISTANKVATQDNIAVDRDFLFIGDTGGRMTSAEDILVDGVGAQTVASDRMLCPFSAAQNVFFPPFCNIVTSGSNVDVSIGSMATSTGARFISSSADTPVEERYLINAKGVSGTDGYSDAIGTVSTSMKAHLQESRELEIPASFETDPIGYVPAGKAEDLSYSETSSATGAIQQFTKNMYYVSGPRLL